MVELEWLILKHSSRKILFYSKYVWNVLQNCRVSFYVYGNQEKHRDTAWILLLKLFPWLLGNIKPQTSHQKVFSFMISSGEIQFSHLQCGRTGFDLWVGKIPWRRAWQPTQYPYLENLHEQRSWGVGVATVYGVSKGQTQLSNFHLLNSMTALIAQSLHISCLNFCLRN